jgi:hypothetical protein
MTRHGGVTMSDVAEMALERENGGDDFSWANMNLTMLKMKKNHAVDSATKKWTVKI